MDKKFFLLLLSFLIHLSKSLCNCSNDSLLKSNPCIHGNCEDDQCYCFDGWGGEFCDTCLGRIKLNDSQGVIIDGINNYTHFSKCSWLVEPSVQHSTLYLKLNTFATECGWDHLYIFDGDSAFGPLIGAFSGVLTGKNSTIFPHVLVASSGTAFLQFISDAALRLAGFNISFSVDCFEDDTSSLCSSKVVNEIPDSHWSELPFNSSELKPRASFALSTFGNYSWLYGGFSFNNHNSKDYVTVFNLNNTSWSTQGESDTFPKPRYHHSMVHWNNSLLVFGGKLINNEKTVDELWQFNTETSVWSAVHYNIDFDHSLLQLSGHTAEMVRFDNGTELMIVFFGYNPQLECSSFIYEYNPVQMTWSLSVNNGAFVHGFIGHTSVYDSTNQLIYIHGGMAPGENTKSTLSDQTFSYNPKTRYLSVLRASGFSRYLHSASIFNGVMYIYGGSSENTAGSQCYSSNFMAYYIDTDRWTSLPSPPSRLQADRYGHKSIIHVLGYSKRLYIISGFDGTMISNTLVYKFPQCKNFSNANACKEGSRQYGVQCYWSNSSCVELTTSSVNSEESLTFCASLSSCSYCLANQYNCQWCTSKCVNPGEQCNDSMKICTYGTAPYCENLRSCRKCESARSVCAWSGKECIEAINGTTDDENTCATNQDCESAQNCTACNNKTRCMWCRNLEKCVATNSYVLQFPYGQCTEWTRDISCSPYACSSYDTCAECQNHTRCGWCDDGSLTGTGTCIDGAQSGPIVFNSTDDLPVIANGVCPAPNWHFTTCPNCQCNGHSTCDEDYKCIYCMDNTIGENCETCADGFYGNSLNGGNCTLCQCGDKAITCDPSSGACKCFTKGEIGSSCEECDMANGYFGNATGNGTCFYTLEENFIFTFTLTEEYVTAINFQNQPKSTDDVILSLTASDLCDVRLAVILNMSNVELLVAEYMMVSSVDYTFLSSEYSFGPLGVNTTIRIYISNFNTTDVPIQIKVSLIQLNNLILKILLGLFSSLLAALLFTAAGWKLKMMYDVYQRRVNRAIQMKEMAARPFANVNLHCDDMYRSTQSLLSPTSENCLLEVNHTPDVFCEEKCGSGDASVASVFLWLPASIPCDKESGENASSTSNNSSDLNYYLSPPPGLSALAIGTVLVNSKDKKKIKKSTTAETNNRCEPAWTSVTDISSSSSHVSM